jgi:hypothetical protein
MVQMLLRVVQKSLGVAEVAAEGGVRGSLVGKAIGVDPPVVLVAGTKQLVVVTPPNLSQIRSVRYAFHHNPRIIVVIHIT